MADAGDADIHAAARVPYRLLEEAPDLSTGDPDTDNMLIYCDNLEALKALLPLYTGQVKCIYIAPRITPAQPLSTTTTISNTNEKRIIGGRGNKKQPQEPVNGHGKMVNGKDARQQLQKKPALPDLEQLPNLRE